VEYFDLLNQSIIDNDDAEAGCSRLADSQLFDHLLVPFDFEQGLNVVQDEIEEWFIECAKIDLRDHLSDQVFIIDIVLLL